jgi:hypothetical protein
MNCIKSISFTAFNTYLPRPFSSPQLVPISISFLNPSISFLFFSCLSHSNPLHLDKFVNTSSPFPSTLLETNAHSSPFHTLDLAHLSSFIPLTKRQPPRQWPPGRASGASFPACNELPYIRTASTNNLIPTLPRDILYTISSAMTHLLKIQTTITHPYQYSTFVYT